MSTRKVNVADLHGIITDLEIEKRNLAAVARIERERADALRDYLYHTQEAGKAALALFSMARPTCGPLEALDDDVPF